MYCTLYTFLHLSPAEQDRVTHLDLSIVDAQDFYRVFGNPAAISDTYFTSAASQLGLAPFTAKDWEEWPGEDGFTYPERTKS